MIKLKRELLDIEKVNSHQKEIKRANAILPKLPRGSYSKSPKEFLKIISKYEPSIKKKLLKRYKSVSASLKMKKKLGGGKLEKLTELQKMELIELAGRYFTPKQLMEIIRNEWKIDYSNTALNALLKRNRELIYQKRLKYISSIDGLRLVHERPRIEELSEIYEDARVVGDNALALQALKEIRQEVKGDRVVLDGNINMDVNLNVKEQLLKQLKLQDFSRLALIKLLDKHKIDFTKIAHRFKLVNVDKEGQTINTQLPVEVDNVFYKQNLEEVKIIEEKNENDDTEKRNINIDKIKELLRKRLQSVKETKVDVSEKEEIVGSEIFDKMNKKKMKKIEKKILKNKIPDKKDLADKLKKLATKNKVKEK